VSQADTFVQQQDTQSRELIVGGKCDVLARKGDQLGIIYHWCASVCVLIGGIKTHYVSSIGGGTLAMGPSKH